MKAEVWNTAGEVVGTADLDTSVFQAPVNANLMQQALVRQLANARQGTHKTRTRSEVRGGGRKPWRQKGTGRARQGTIRAPQWVGGGTVFGPTPRSYRKQMPKAMRRAAVRSALTVKAEAEAIRIVETEFGRDLRTRDMDALLRAMQIRDRRTLIVHGPGSDSIQRAIRNLTGVGTLHYMYANVRDLLQADVVLVTQDAQAGLENWLGGVAT
ncbi:MAG: 50S ribosomal protein L4 [Caldilineaceae bacterium]|nr:50S ribosomal protein L4 [Caldilineaceae bacterium]